MVPPKTALSPCRNILADERSCSAPSAEFLLELCGENFTAETAEDSQRSQRQTSDIRPLFGIARQVPARPYAGVRKERMNTSFRCWGIEDELCLSILLQHGIVAGDDDGSVRIPIHGKAHAKHRKVHAKDQQRCRQNEEDYREEDAPEAVSQIGRRHGPIISPPETAPGARTGSAGRHLRYVVLKADRSRPTTSRKSRQPPRHAHRPAE